MAKNIKKLMAMTLVVCMLVSALPLQALAAEGDGVEHSTEKSPEGFTTNVTTTQTTTTNEGGNKTVTVTIEKDTAGELKDGSDLERHQTNTESKTYDENGKQVGASGVETGKETVKDIVDLPEGGVTVTVPGKVGDSDSEEFGDTSQNGIPSGDIKEGEEDTEYDQTTTTVTPGKVTVTTTDKTYSQEFSDDTKLEYTNADVTPDGTNDLFYHQSGTASEEYLPGYEGETVIPDPIKGYDYVYVGSGNTSNFIPAIVFTQPLDDEGKLDVNTSSPYLTKTYYDENGVKVSTGNEAHNPEDKVRIGKDENGNDMTLLEDGILYYLDQDGNKILRTEKTMVGPDGETYYLHRLDVPNGSYKVEGWYEDGEWVKDLNGKNKYVAVWGGPQQFLLVDSQGNVITTYCADQTDPTENGYGYNIVNLEDATYYSEEEAARIRSIAKNGYWGVAGESEGSLEYMKQQLKLAGFTDDELASLTDGVALTATQMAIWGCSNKMSGINFVNAYYNSGNGWSVGDIASDKEGEVKLMMKIYTYLSELDGSKTEGNMRDTVVTAENSITDLNVTVLEKAKDHQNNKDDDKKNDAYVTDLSFALVVEPSGDQEESLKVTLVTADGQTVVGRICGEKQEGEQDLERDEQGNYWFRNIVLTEGGQTFTLNLEGVQNLDEGVYLYSSEVRDGNSSQTLVGKAGGKRDFDVTVNLSFDLDVEEGVVVKERIWRNEYDPKENPPEDPNNPPDTPWNPPQIRRLANDGIEIPEEPVPLATPVITGDSTGVWVALFLMVAVGMVALNLFDKKRKNETF